MRSFVDHGMQLELGLLIISGELVSDMTSGVETVAGMHQPINGFSFSSFPFTTYPEGFFHTVTSDLFVLDFQKFGNLSGH